MKPRRSSEEQITFAVRQAEVGSSVEEVCRKLGSSRPTFYEAYMSVIKCFEGSVALADRTSAGPLSFTQAASPKIWWTKARWAGMSSPGTARTCPLASIAIASTPARVRRAVQKL